jgi:sulfite exporter TauE/SafE
MDLISGFLVGFLGSVHCAGMCGPLALALPVPGGGTLAYIFGRVLYNAGRVLTYAVLGAAAGLVGRTLVLAGAQQMVSLILGVLILLSVLLPFALGSLLPSFTLPARFSAYVQSKLTGLMKRSSNLALFVIGLLNGLLPCGFVYVAMGAAITTGEVYRGVLFMTGFGVGTGPVMLVIALAGKHVQAGIRRRLAALAPVFTAVLAVLIILRGLNLGIPYISPAVSVKPSQEQQYCH